MHTYIYIYTNITYINIHKYTGYFIRDCFKTLASYSIKMTFSHAISGCNILPFL